MLSFFDKTCVVGLPNFRTDKRAFSDSALSRIVKLRAAGNGVLLPFGLSLYFDTTKYRVINEPIANIDAAAASCPSIISTWDDFGHRGLAQCGMAHASGVATIVRVAAICAPFDGRASVNESSDVIYGNLRRLTFELTGPLRRVAKGPE